MNPIDEYIKWQDFGNNSANEGENWQPRYQLLTWMPSALVGGFQTVTIPTDESGNVLFIRIHQMSISTDGLGGTITFSDKRIVTPLFSIINNISFWSVGGFDYIVNDTKFTMVSNSATVQFALGYSPISKGRFRIKK